MEGYSTLILVDFVTNAENPLLEKINFVPEEEIAVFSWLQFDVQTRNILGERELTVRPVRSVAIPEALRKATGMTAKDLNGGVPLSEALREVTFSFLWVSSMNLLRATV